MESTAWSCGPVQWRTRDGLLDGFVDRFLEDVGDLDHLAAALDAGVAA